MSHFVFLSPFFDSLFMFSFFPLTFSFFVFSPFFLVRVSAFCSVAIGIGFYGNSEANDGMYQLTSSLLTANYTLASIDLLVRTQMHTHTHAHTYTKAYSINLLKHQGTKRNTGCSENTLNGFITL